MLKNTQIAGLLHPVELWYTMYYEEVVYEIFYSPVLYR